MDLIVFLLMGFCFWKIICWAHGMYQESTSIVLLNIDEIDEILDEGIREQEAKYQKRINELDE